MKVYLSESKVKYVLLEVITNSLTISKIILIVISSFLEQLLFHFYYSAQNGSEFRFRYRCFICRRCVEIIMVCSTVRQMNARAIV